MHDDECENCEAPTERPGARLCGLCEWWEEEKRREAEWELAEAERRAWEGKTDRERDDAIRRAM